LWTTFWSTVDMILCLARCVLRYDHFCPWADNIIGHYNYRSFILLLIYGVLSVAGVALASTLCLATHFYNFASSDHLTSPPSLWVYIIWIASFTVGFGLCNLWSFHMHLLRYNYTTKEYFLRKNDAKSNTNASPYDRGLFHNLAEVFGGNVLLWWCPWVGGPSTDGYHYQKVEKFRQ